MKYLELKNGRRVIVDDEDYPYLSRFTWLWTDEVVMYMIGRNDKRFHIPITSFIIKKKRTCRIFHKNNNRLDNRKENLAYGRPNEIVHHASKSVSKKYSSIYKGVCFRKSRGGKPWRAAIRKEGITYNLGTYDMEKQAAEAYNIKALELYGEDAYQNKI